MKDYKKTAVFVLMTGLIFMSFMSGYFIREIEATKSFFGHQDTDFTLIMEAYTVLKNEFVDPNGIDDKKLIHGAVSGMVDSLRDPYTTFFNSEDTKRFLEDSEGKFEGVGMEVGLRDNQFQVIAPLKGTPADKAGLLPGDNILMVDEVETKDISVDEAVNLIRGQKGTEVKLSIMREGWNEPRDFFIARDIIDLPSLEWEMIDGEIAHIKFYHFSRNVDSEFKKMVLDILGSSTKGIILDMRGNPGGYLEVSREIAGWFLEKGEVFVIEDSIKGKKKDTVSGTGRLSQYPTVVLINEGSASASEILAGALRDNRSIQLIGKTSFGKGSIQSLERLSDGSSIKITIARWLTPKGETISEKGLAPDLEVDMTPEDYEKERDPQLDKAIEVIKGMI